jgi:hypothetical protein
MRRAFPDTTEFFSTWADQREEWPEGGFHIVSLSSLPHLARRLRDPRVDLIVVHSSPFAPWHLRAVSRAIFRRSALHGRIALVRNFGQQLLRLAPTAPVAVVDLDDPPVIPRSELFLLDRSTLYFKRELPPDHWRLFAGTVHWKIPTPRFRSIPRHQQRLSKVRPISLGVSAEVSEWNKVHAIPAADKTVDVFFAGRIGGSSTVRQRGLAELLSLRADGYVIDISDARLPIGEYLARCARARIVWSPEGLGWQSFRTYEAALCNAVPLSNRPTIELYKPLIAGIHALYYDPEPGALRQATASALADPLRLGQIAAAARGHVLAHHTQGAIAHHILARTLQAAGISAYADATAADP